MGFLGRHLVCFVVVIASTLVIAHCQLACENIDSNSRFDCFPGAGPNEEECLERGCCWIATDVQKEVTKLPKSQIPSVGVPACFYPSNYAGYSITNVSTSPLGITSFLELRSTSPYPKDVPTLQLDAIFETENRLRIRIYDPLNKRFEPPYPIVPSVSTPATQTNYDVLIDESKVGFQIIRKSDNTVIFNTQNVGGLIYADQFLQLSALIPSSNIYGLGEHRDTFRLHSDWKRFSFLTHDAPPAEDTNLYGVHALYLLMENTGNSHGVFLLNSAPMEIILQPTPAITYRALGGIFDFYFFLGPTPSDVVKQYTEVVGRPFMPPFWSLGFHLCKSNYGSLETVREVWQRNRDAGIPFDVQWTDTDYMYRVNDFTYNNITYAGFPEFVDEVHSVGMRWIPIIDAGIGGSEPPGTYTPYDDALEMDLLIKHSNGDVLHGLVWNVDSTVWPDFTHPRAVEYYTKQLSEFYSVLPYDGIWIDMNEPSNVLNDGSLTGCAENELDNPPYVIGVDNGKLNFRTTCMSAQQYAGTHYDVHNLYGTTHAAVTNAAITTVLGKRPFVISRSSFAGHGYYSGHWSGDNESSWYDLKKTIAELLSFSLFGVSMMGADICGFRSDTTVALCQRWQELGAFYTFSRNHNGGGQLQDPAFLGPDVIEATRKANTIRYSLLPFLYTLLWEAHTTGTTVARPVFFEFAEDHETYNLETQFLWGSGLMIAPVMDEGVTEREVYFPAGRWYDYYSGALVVNNISSGTNITTPAPLDTIPLFIRGGSILPMQVPGLTTNENRNNPFELLVALDGNGLGSGSLYWDDGDSFVEVDSGTYNHITFAVQNKTLISSIEHLTYDNSMPLTKITILGVESVTSVMVNGEEVVPSYDINNQVLTIGQLESVFLQNELTVSWA